VGRQVTERTVKVQASRRASFEEVSERVYRFIVEFRRRRGRYPELREVSLAFGYRQRHGARIHINVLTEQGRIVRPTKDGYHHGIALPEDDA
jgi:SOS-response transcriptional repressor LexA